MFLGIDLGTSGVKAIIINDRQGLVAEAASRPLTVTRLKPGWAEQEPASWWEAVCEALDSLRQSHPKELAAVEGIGLSGQMYGATILGDDDQPLRPAILWNDTRSSAECLELTNAVPDLLNKVGRRPTPGVTATKLLWLRRHEAGIFKKIRKVLLPKDYIRLLLCGETASDLADSSGTMWVDLAKRDWSDELLAATGLERGHMPQLYEGTDVTGRLRDDLASRWGMLLRPVIAGGGGDNACGACGVGATEEGNGTVSLGTSGVLFVANNSPRTIKGAAVESLCHAVPDRWHQMSVVLSATSCLTWLGTRLKKSPAELINALGDQPRPATDLLFIPFLDGSWSPRNDPDIRGGFVGLAHQHDDAAMTHAVLQGVSFALLECCNAFRTSGTPLSRLLAIGGGSRSRLWLSILATALDVELDLPKSSELGAAFGAARLGIIAAGNVKPETVLHRPELSDMVSPEPRFSDSYAQAFERWEASIGHH